KLARVEEAPAADHEPQLAAGSGRTFEPRPGRHADQPPDQAGAVRGRPGRAGRRHRCLPSSLVTRSPPASPSPFTGGTAPRKLADGSSLRPAWPTGRVGRPQRGNSTEK